MDGPVRTPLHSQDHAVQTGDQGQVAVAVDNYMLILFGVEMHAQRSTTSMEARHDKRVANLCEPLDLSRRLPLKYKEYTYSKLCFRYCTSRLSGLIVQCQN